MVNGLSMIESLADVLRILYALAKGHAGWLPVALSVSWLLTFVVLGVAFARPRRTLVASSYGLLALAWTSGFAALVCHRGLLFSTPPETYFDRAYEEVLYHLEMVHIATGAWGTLLSLSGIAVAAKTRCFALAAGLVPFVCVGVAMVSHVAARRTHALLDVPRWAAAHVDALRPLQVAFVLSGVVAILVAAWPSRRVAPPWLAVVLLALGITTFVTTRPHAYDALHPIERGEWVAQASEAHPPGKPCRSVRFGYTVSFGGGLQFRGEPASRDEVRAELIVPEERWWGSSGGPKRLLLQDLPSPDEAAWLDTWREKVPEVVLLRDRTRWIWTATYGWIERHDLCESPWPAHTNTTRQARPPTARERTDDRPRPLGK